MSGARSESSNQSLEQSFIGLLSQADAFALQPGVRLPFIYLEYKKAIELYQKIPVEGQSESLLAHYSDCRDKYLRHSSKLMTDLIKTALVTEALKAQLTQQAKTVLDLRENILTPSDDLESRNQAIFREQILHLKQDLEIVKAAGDWGFNCINMPKDGNCLFNAIADQLKLNELVITNPLHNEPHHALRSLAVKHLRTNQECYAVHIPNDKTVRSYTEELARSGTWGDHLEIMALVRELSITLVLIQDDQNIMVFKAEHPKAIFYLGYETNYHFVSFHKQDNLPLRTELAAKIAEAPVVEVGPYILHAVVEVKKKISTASSSELKKVVPATTDKKTGSSLLDMFFKPSSSSSSTEDKSNPKTPNKLLNLFTKGSSSSLGPR